MSATLPITFVSFLHRPFVAATGISLLLGTALFALAPSRGLASESPSGGSPPAPKVTVNRVEVRLVTEFEEITGRVDATETVDLRARVSGHLESINFNAGQLVKKGDVLLTIDPRWYQAQYDLAVARADIATREAKRAEDLLAASAISSEEAESRRAKAAEARAELTTARLDLEHTRVEAPITGRISRALVTPGNLIAGAPGGATLLATIVSTGDAYVYADLDETTLLKFNRLARENRLVTESGHVPVDLQLGDETDYPRHGFIESMDNHVNPTTGSLTVRMLFPNADGALVPGLFARVRLPVGEPQDRLLVSERAIGTDQSQKFVLTVDNDNTVSYRTVKLGANVEGKRIIRQGLKPGETIIVNGLQRVRPGMTVAPVSELAASQLPASGGSKIAAAR